MSIISIHQPGYMPWLGFFKKIMFSDVFVFLDDVQYEKNGWHNRNKIKTSDGSIWLTVPVNSKKNQKLNEISIDNTSDWSKKHRKALYLNYVKSPFFELIWPELELIYQKNYELLLEINLDIIHLILNKLNIKTKILMSSDLKICKSGSDRILEICKKLHTTTYLSGIQGKNYLKIQDFEKNKIRVLFQNFQHPIYNQLYESFIPNLSTLDLLFNEGVNARDILKESKNF